MMKAENVLKRFYDAIMMGDQRVAAGRLADAQATAMENAASNEAGAMNRIHRYGICTASGRHECIRIVSTSSAAR